jgi:hypothetical protein
MPETKSGRVDILHQLAVPGGVAAEDTGNHFLLRLTWRSQRCRSGSEISGAGLYQRQGAERRSRGVEGCGILDELNDCLETCETWGQTNVPVKLGDRRNVPVIFDSCEEKHEETSRLSPYFVPIFPHISFASPP